MDERDAGNDGMTVILSPEAGYDLAAIYTYTEQLHGSNQAEYYVQFLKSSAQQIAQRPDWGNPVADRPGMFERVVKWKGSRHGHRIVYRVTISGIYVLAILHTARDWRNIIPE